MTTQQKSQQSFKPHLFGNQLLSEQEIQQYESMINGLYKSKQALLAYIMSFASYFNVMDPSQSYIGKQLSKKMGRDKKYRREQINRLIKNLVELGLVIKKKKPYRKGFKQTCIYEPTPILKDPEMRKRLSWLNALLGCLTIAYLYCPTREMIQAVISSSNSRFPKNVTLTRINGVYNKPGRIRYSYIEQKDFQTVKKREGDLVMSEALKELPTDPGRRIISPIPSLLRTQMSIPLLIAGEVKLSGWSERILALAFADFDRRRKVRDDISNPVIYVHSCCMSHAKRLGEAYNIKLVAELTQLYTINSYDDFWDKSIGLPAVEDIHVEKSGQSSGRKSDKPLSTTEKISILKKNEQIQSEIDDKNKVVRFIELYEKHTTEMKIGGDPKLNANQRGIQANLLKMMHLKSSQEAQQKFSDNDNAILSMMPRWPELAVRFIEAVKDRDLIKGDIFVQFVE